MEWGQCAMTRIVPSTLCHDTVNREGEFNELLYSPSCYALQAYDKGYAG